MKKLLFVSIVLFVASCGQGDGKKAKVESVMPVPIHQVINDIDSLPFESFIVMRNMEDMYKDRYDTVELKKFMLKENGGKPLFVKAVQPFKNRSHLYQLFSKCEEGKVMTAEYQWHRGMYLMIAPLDTIDCPTEYESYLAN